MNAIAPTAERTSELSMVARSRLLSRRGEPLLIADWDRALMLHFEVDAEKLQQAVPFELDLWEGRRAFVSLVAFTMRGMRLHAGGGLGAWLLKPLATHAFLNVRTYVRHDGESGIHFLAEWLPNPLAVLLGPRIFGLPYRLGRLDYSHQHESGFVQGTVEDVRVGSLLGYAARIEEDAHFAPCTAGSLDEWLMERYTAFNAARGRRRFFRVWHDPWEQVSEKFVWMTCLCSPKAGRSFETQGLSQPIIRQAFAACGWDAPTSSNKRDASDNEPYASRQRRTARASFTSSNGF